MNKKLLLISLAILIGMSVANLANATFAGGDGSPGNPYQITTCTDLQAMENDLSASYVLNSDIDCSDTISWNYDCDGEGNHCGFDPIGELGDYFTGSFNGNNHKITDLFINRLSEYYVGLFGYVGLSATIQNVGLVGGSVSGIIFVGGFAGNNSGTINNSYSTCNVYSSGDIRDQLSWVAGFIGYNSGTINNSYATGNVSGLGDYVGGFVGENGGNIYNSYSMGDVSGGLLANEVGGFAGDNHSGSINNSYATGSVSGDICVGGFSGYNEAIISNSYSTGNVSGNDTVGGFTGMDNGGSISNSYATGSVSSEGAYIGGFAGENYGTTINIYWFDWPEDDVSNCNVANCTVINAETGGIPYFYNISNPPMDLWNFFSIWGTWFDGTDYPPLLWQDTTPPSDFTLSLPVNDSSTSKRKPTFSWNASQDLESGLAKYELYLDDALLIDDIEANTLSAIPTSNLSCGQHAWYVKATDLTEKSTDSNTHTLRITCGSAITKTSYNIVFKTSPLEAGIIPGSGSYPEGTSITVNASPKPGYIFLFWEENGNEISKDPFYRFIVNSNQELIARFRAVEEVLLEEKPPIEKPIKEMTTGELKTKIVQIQQQIINLINQLIQLLQSQIAELEV